MIQPKSQRRIGQVPRSAAVGLLILLCARPASPYSVLTHEAIIDSTWDSAIKPVLLKQYPASTQDELTKAHAYAYGGSIIQDLGYYPFGSKFYSDLTHYVRTGDFILNLIREAQNLNEYAFALGALSHYAADSDGHRIATNVTVPVLFPELARKFGKVVTYSDDPLSHSRTEFAFDVFQAAKSRYAPAAYKSFIGFEVAKPVLERAFEDTYGIRIEKVFLKFDLAIGTYRRAVGTVIPALTKVAWQIKQDEIRRDAPGATRKTFLYNLSRSSYNTAWGSMYRRPGIGTRLLAGFLSILPRVGPLRALAFRKLTPATEQFYMAGFNAAIEQYRGFLSALSAKRLKLPNQNIDTGDLTQEGKYKLADSTYAKLLHSLAGHYLETPQELRSNILAFYQDASLLPASDSVREDLNYLKAVDLDSAVAPGPRVPAGTSIK